MSVRTSPSRSSTTIGSIEWIHFLRTDARVVKTLERRFAFHPIDLQETLPPLQRPKLVERDGYIFMILLYPLFDRATKTVLSSEVDFFISPDRLVTVNTDNLPALTRSFQRGGKVSTPTQLHETVAGNVTALIYTVLNDLLQETFRMLIHIRQDITTIEQRLFSDFDSRLIEEILRVKTNIVNARQALQGHKSVITQLVATLAHDPAMRSMNEYYDHLLDETKELWDHLQLQRDTIDALHQANESLLNYRMSSIMRTLTMLSVFTFPLTLIAATFAMRTKNMPLVELDGGFWIILGLMLGTVGVMILFFRKKKWL